VLNNFDFRIPPAVGGAIGIALMALGTTSSVASLVIAGAVVVAAASVRFLVWR
jgi:hypothetical protein